MAAPELAFLLVVNGAGDAFLLGKARVAGAVPEGAALGHAFHSLLPSTNEAVIACALMAAANTGVTKTPIGSTLVVSKMVGLALVPSTAIAAVVALLMTHRSGLFTSQRERFEVE